MFDRLIVEQIMRGGVIFHPALSLSRLVLNHLLHGRLEDLVIVVVGGVVSAAIDIDVVEQWRMCVQNGRRHRRFGTRRRIHNDGCCFPSTPVCSRLLVCLCMWCTAGRSGEWGYACCTLHLAARTLRLVIYMMPHTAAQVRKHNIKLTNKKNERSAQHHTPQALTTM